MFFFHIFFTLQFWCHLSFSRNCDGPCTTTSLTTTSLTQTTIPGATTSTDSTTTSTMTTTQDTVTWWGKMWKKKFSWFWLVHLSKDINIRNFRGTKSLWVLQKASLKDLKLPSCFHIFQLMISPSLKKGITFFWVVAQTSSTLKASRHAGLWCRGGTFDSRRLELPSIAVSGRWVALSVFRFPFSILESLEIFQGEASWHRASLQLQRRSISGESTGNHRRILRKSRGNPWTPRWMWLQQRWICGVAVDWLTHGTGALGQSLRYNC